MALTPGSAGNIERQQPANGLPDKNGNGHHRPETRPAPMRRRAPWWRALALPLVVGAACGGGAFYTAQHFIKPTYSTGTTLLFASAGGGGGLASLLGAAGPGAGADTGGSVPLLPGIYSAPLFGSTPGSAMSVMATGTFQAKIVNKLKLPARWHVAPSEAFARLGKEVSYGVDRNGFLAVSATDPDPKLAAKIVNTYVQTLQQMTKQLNSERIRLYRRKMELTLQNRSRALSLKNAQLVALQTGNIRRYPLGTGANATYQDLVTQKIATTAELNATATTLQKQIQTARRTYNAGAGLPTSVTFAGDTLLRLRSAESAFRSAKNLLGPDNPEYQKAELALTQARAEFKNEAKRQSTAVNTGLTANIADLQQKQAALAGKLDFLNKTSAPIKDVLLNLPAARVREEQLTSDIGLERGQVNTLKIALQTARLVEGSQTLPAFSVMDPAGVPDKPSAPRPLYMMVFAAIAGFLLAAALQVARAVWRQPVLVGEVRRWTEKYIIMDPYDGPDAPPALEDEEGPRRSLPGDSARRALPGDPAATMEIPAPPAARETPSERGRKP